MKILEQLSDKQKKTLSWLSLIVLVGVGLLIIQPSSNRQNPQPLSTVPSTPVAADFAAEAQYVENRLAQLLSAVAGIRKADVFVTLERGPRLNIAEEVSYEQQAGETTRQTTAPALVRNGQVENPIILQKDWPEVRGVLIVADGAEDPIVRLKIAQAVQTVLQIEMYRIEVLPRN